MATATARPKAAGKPPPRTSATHSASIGHEVWRKWRGVLIGLSRLTKRSQFTWARVEAEMASRRSAVLIRMLPKDLAKDLAMETKMRKVNPAECKHSSCRNYGNATGSFRHCPECSAVWKKDKDKGDWTPFVSRTYGGHSLKTELHDQMKCLMKVNDVAKKETSSPRPPPSVSPAGSPSSTSSGRASSAWVMAGNEEGLVMNRSCSACNAKNAAQAKRCMMCGSALDISMTSEKKRSNDQPQGGSAATDHMTEQEADVSGISETSVEVTEVPEK